MTKLESNILNAGNEESRQNVTVYRKIGQNVGVSKIFFILPAGS